MIDLPISCVTVPDSDNTAPIDLIASLIALQAVAAAMVAKRGS